jgi:hypothetical protein
VSVPEFEFDLNVDGRVGAGPLADAVAAEILRHLGYPTDAATRFAAAIRSALAEVCTRDGACHVQFRAQSGELEVIVSTGEESTRRVVRAR